MKWPIYYKFSTHYKVYSTVDSPHHCSPLVNNTENNDQVQAWAYPSTAPLPK